jgi:NAD(P)-dependent dehydrogenase (short-subunit alcohol dehydrogenase family)
LQITLEDKVAIVTGAAGGIGAATATEFAASGAKVLVADIDAAAADRVAATIKETGGVAEPFVVDLADESQVEAMVAAAAGVFGGLDILHNNAAATTARVPDTILDKMRTAWWDDMFAINLRGPMIASRAALPLMAARGGGSIINTSSTVSLLATGSLFAYASAKAALNQLTVNTAALVGRRNIRCNAVAPGSVATPRLVEVLDESSFAAMSREAVLPRVVLPIDIARMVTFLASDASSAITGQIIAVDAGLAGHFGGWADLMRARYGEEFDRSAVTWDELLATVDQARLT